MAALRRADDRCLHGRPDVAAGAAGRATTTPLGRAAHRLRLTPYTEYPVPAFPGKDEPAMTAVEQPTEATTERAPVHTSALIIGTGFSGLGMGIALQRQGV